MKIAIVVNTSWNIYNFRLSLTKALLKEGHTIYAIAPFDSYSKLLEEKGCVYKEIKMDNKGTNPLKDIYLIYNLYKAYKNIKPDIILHYTIKPNIYGSIAAKMIGIPVINNVSGLGTVFLHNTISSQIAIQLYRLAFRYPKKVFFQNKDDKKLFIEKKLIKEEITDLVPGSGVDTVKFSPLPFRRNKTFRFLLIARLLYDKGIIEYYQAAKKIKKEHEAEFFLMGSPDQSALGIPLSLVMEWDKENTIKYLPFSENVAEAIHEADCIVLPSYREGAPKTLLEAAACGKPLLATDVPGCREVVEDSVNGYLCKVKDAQELADKMVKMIDQNPEKLKRMGEESRKIAIEKFDERIVIEKYLKAINGIFI